MKNSAHRRRPATMISGAAVLFGIVILAVPARLTTQRNNPVDQHGRGCISIRQASREQPTHRGVWENYVLVANSCTRTIRLTVCYAFTTNCIAITAPPMRETEHLLGTKNEPGFRYSWSAE